MAFAILLFLAACGGGGVNGGSASPPPATPTASPSGATPQALVTPSRSTPPSANHQALEVLDLVTFLKQTIGSGVSGAKSCPYEATDGIIDCSSQGYGRIALDPIPHGADQWDCRVELTPMGQAFAASCISVGSPNAPVTFIYGIIQ